VIRRGRYEVFCGLGGWYWRLVAANGEIVAQSEAYTRPADARRGAHAARGASRRARIVEVEK
jgi:uncharacterized protein YegP (UPF0339 family)